MKKKPRAIFPYIDYLDIRHQPVQAVLRAGCAPCSLCSVQPVHLEVCAVNQMFTSFDQSRKYYEYNRISLYTMEIIPNVDSICTNSVRLLTQFWTYSVHFSLYLQCGKWVILKASTVEVKAVVFSVKNKTLPLNM